MAVDLLQYHEEALEHAAKSWWAMRCAGASKASRLMKAAAVDIYGEEAFEREIAAIRKAEGVCRRGSFVGRTYTG